MTVIFIIVYILQKVLYEKRNKLMYELHERA